MSAADGGWPPAWHPDPDGRPMLRWWDGSSWTTHVCVDGRTFDEAAAAAPANAPETAPPIGDAPAAEPVTATAAVAGGSPVEAALRALAQHRFLAYHEREPGTYGGRIDIVEPGGAPVAVAEGDSRSQAWGFLASDVVIHLAAGHGTRLGSIVRKGRSLRENHPILDHHGVMFGEFLGPVVTPSATVQTAAGQVARLELGRRDNFLVEPSGRRLAKIAHVQGHRLVEFGFDSWLQHDVFVLELLASLPAWLFVIALLAPIESNLRGDTGRAGSSTIGAPGI